MLLKLYIIVVFVLATTNFTEEELTKAKGKLINGLNESLNKKMTESKLESSSFFWDASTCTDKENDYDEKISHNVKFFGYEKALDIFKEYVKTAKRDKFREGLDYIRNAYSSFSTALIRYYIVVHKLMLESKYKQGKKILSKDDCIRPVEKEYIRFVKLQKESKKPVYTSLKSEEAFLSARFEENKQRFAEALIQDALEK